ncbi:MAG TPA: aminotransferase class V-fold PLP-dependent enzyme [Gemmatimonadota bacterium]|nr:aminotransferase class V-fold PLP-dependent enzyme [Gemmatimonadota bacterium]
MDGRMDRRRFLAGAGAVTAGALASGAAGLDLANRARRLVAVDAHARPFDPGDWGSVRESFSLSPDVIHMGALYIASNPAPVRDAIADHRMGLDRDPVPYLQRHERASTYAALDAAARYMAADPEDLALTDSTTMGLGLLYTGLRLLPGQEILTTEHDYYVTHEATRMAAERTGATVRRIRLHEPADLTREGIDVEPDRIAERVAREIRPATRVVALTWVHSGTGLKLPLDRIAHAVHERTGDRAVGDRPLLCVDGVHGFGVEDVGMGDTGFDFFAAGCHKWLFGPRGTGVVWGRGPDAWSLVRPTIPSFLDTSLWTSWARGAPPAGETTARRATPGGFKAFEHRWALEQAFDFLSEIGKNRIAARTHELARRLKEGLVEIPRVQLVTPLAESVSSGIVCFDVEGMSAASAVDRLGALGVVATVTPYATTYARLAPSILNSPEEVDAAIAAVRQVAS